MNKPAGSPKGPFVLKCDYCSVLSEFGGEKEHLDSIATAHGWSIDTIGYPSDGENRPVRHYCPKCSARLNPVK